MSTAQTFNVAQTSSNGFVPELVKFDPATPYAYANDRQTITEIYGIPANTDLIPKHNFISRNNLQYRRIAQTIFDTPVLGNELTIVIKNNNVQRIRGKWFSEIPPVSTAVIIDQVQAIYFGASFWT